MHWLNNTQIKHNIYYLDFCYTNCGYIFSGIPHAKFSPLQEVHHLYLLLLRLIVNVSRYLTFETTGVVLTHSVGFLVEIWNESTQEPFKLDLKYLWKWTLLPHL